VVSVWKTPHGIPHKISPTRSVSTWGAKNGMKKNAIIMAKDTIIVFIYLYLSLTIALTKRPRISPHKAPLDNALFQLAGTCTFHLR
jgi:hypothetical protein